MMKLNLPKAFLFSRFRIIRLIYTNFYELSISQHSVTNVQIISCHAHNYALLCVPMQCAISIHHFKVMIYLSGDAEKTGNKIKKIRRDT